MVFHDLSIAFVLEPHKMTVIQISKILFMGYQVRAVLTAC